MIIGGLKAFYSRNRVILQLNKNMILSGIVGFFISAIAAEEYYRYTQNDLILSVATVLTGFAVSNAVFAILFHIDSRYLYVDRSTGKINFQILKRILKKLTAAGAVFEIVNNSSRFIILYVLFYDRYGSTKCVNAIICCGIRPVLFIHKFSAESIWTFSNKQYYQFLQEIDA